MAYTLSKILVAAMGGSLGLLARGASQKKCSSSAHIGPPVFFAFSMSAFTSGESGLSGAGGACPKHASPKASASPVLIDFIYMMIVIILSLEIVGPRHSGCQYEGTSRSAGGRDKSNDSRRGEDGDPQQERKR